MQDLLRDRDAFRWAAQPLASNGLVMANRPDDHPSQCPTTNDKHRTPFSGSDIRVLCVIPGKQLLLFVHLGEYKEDEHCSQQDHNDPGEVSPLVARQERSLRRVYDMARVLRILLRDVGRAAERLLERGLDAARDLLPVWSRGDG